MNSYLAVAIGGAIGAILRFAVSEWVGAPQGTLIVNAVGSLLLGVCMAALANEIISEEMTLLLGTGILGAFTTMSAFSVETIEMWNDDQTKCITLWEDVGCGEKYLPSPQSVTTTATIAVVATSSALLAKPIADLVMKVVKPVVKKLMAKVQKILGKTPRKPTLMEKMTDQYREKKGLLPMKRKK